MAAGAGHSAAAAGGARRGVLGVLAGLALGTVAAVLLRPDRRDRPARP